MAGLFKHNGKPSIAALSLAKELTHALETQRGAYIRLHLKSYGRSGRTINPGEHNIAVRMLQNAHVKFYEGNDAPRGGKIGDYIGLSRIVAREILDTINAANIDAATKGGKKR